VRRLALNREKYLCNAQIHVNIILRRRQIIR
jgi:hypothetical protein